MVTPVPLSRVFSTTTNDGQPAAEVIDPDTTEQAPDAAAIFQEKLANAFKTPAPAFGAAAGAYYQLRGVEPALADLLGRGVKVSLQQSADAAAASSVQGALKSGDLAKDSFEGMTSKKSKTNP